MGQVGAAAIRRVNGNRKYKIGSAAKMLYPASGMSWLNNAMCGMSANFSNFTVIKVSTILTLMYSHYLFRRKR
jgi:hypothetical protein